MVRISEVSFKIRKIARFYDLDHINLTTTTTTTITTGYLQKFQDGLQILAVRGLNRSKKFLKKSLMPAFLFLRIYEDSSYKSSSIKSNERRFGRSALLISKTFAQTCTALTLLDKLEV